MTEQIFEFDRYTNGELKAQGIRITKATDFADAIRRAVKLEQSEMSPRDVSVLVPTRAPTPQQGDIELAREFFGIGDDVDPTPRVQESLDALAAAFSRVREDQKERDARIAESYDWVGDYDVQSPAQHQTKIAVTIRQQSAVGGGVK